MKATMKKLFSLPKWKLVIVSVATLAVAVGASAALLTLYVTMTGTANVEQSVVFGDGSTEKTYEVGDSPAIAGNTYTQNYNLKNKSETTAPIKFVTSYKSAAKDWWHSPEEGIETSYWSTVVLENKDTSWDPIIESEGNEIQGTLTYNLVSPTFEYEFEAEGLTASTEYSLIYYADKPDRFVDWGGNNPGVLIATFTTDSDGDIPLTTGSENLAMNLPHVDDANNDEYDYCKTVANGGTDDMYDLCHGAKIWLVPSTDYSEPALTVWNPTTYLFETDLITYDDSDTDGEALWLGEGMLNFFVKNVFDIALMPQNYTIKTEIIPVP